MSNKAPKNQVTLTERSPVIAVMGHIDHGKSTLLDYIRKTNVCAKEAGGITQHMAAYEVCHERAGKKHNITFLDTPGHAAFKGIRVRGASVADIAILVVSAEEGVKPQTTEALQCIKDAGIPYLVAINKIDSPKADIERTKQSLAEHEIYVEGYGGQIPWVAISGKSGSGIPELFDMILLLAELGEFKGDTSKLATGVVIEGNMDARKGTSATLIIKDGSLAKGMFVVSGESLAPIRMMEDFKGDRLEAAHFSTPVKIYGFSTIPKIGELFATFTTKKEAEVAVAEAAEKKAKFKATNVAAQRVANPITAINSAEAEPTAEPVTLNFIIKADVSGTLEAIEHEFAKLSKKSPSTILRIVQSGIGDISEADVKMAVVRPGTKLIGFNTRVDVQAKGMAERLNVDVQVFDIIYKLIEWVEAYIEKNAPKITSEIISGTAKILKVFSKNRDKQVVGGRVISGNVKLGDEVRISRREAEIGTGKIRELQQQKLKAEEVNKDSEFGTLIESKIEIAPGDRIECFSLVTK